MERSLLVIAGNSHALSGVEGLDRLAYEVSHAPSLPDGIRSIFSGAPDAVILVASGAVDEQCAVLRAVAELPLIVVESGTRLPARIVAACFDAGADAVVQLPFTIDELDAQIRGVWRRLGVHEEPVPSRQVIAGDLFIDFDTRSVTHDGKEIRLSPLEFSLLSVLAESAGKPVTNRDLLERVWGREYTDDVHYVRLYISYLRNKIEADPQRPRILLNQWGVGYRLAARSGDGM
jgi:two-component system KDP operon response regulator KdpE